MYTPERNSPETSSSTKGCGLCRTAQCTDLDILWAEESQVVGTGNLQPTMLEGHDINPPDLDLSAIDGKCFLYFRAKLARMVPNLGWPCS